MKAHRAGSIAFARAGLYGAGDAFAGSPSHCQAHQLVRSDVHSEVDTGSSRGGRRRRLLCLGRGNSRPSAPPVSHHTTTRHIERGRRGIATTLGFGSAGFAR